MALAHFTLATRSVRKSSEFFQSTFGWEAINRPSNAPVPTGWLRITAGQEVHLVEIHDFEPPPFEREFGRHIALLYPVTEFPALKDRLVQNGAELIEPGRETPFERFFFKDPNGYVFEVMDENRDQFVSG